MNQVLETVTELYDFLEDIMPVKRVLLALAVGIVSLLIVLISGLTSDFVRSETIASRAFSAFSYSTLITFILIMGGEEYAIFRTNKELENFIDDAQIAETGEEFNREEYLHEDDEEILEEAVQENSLQDETDNEGDFHQMDFGAVSNQH